jgi:multidrug efflux pump
MNPSRLFILRPVATALLMAAINAARSYLPTTLPNNPIYRKVNPADAPILILALTSQTVSRAQMYDAASTILQQKLSQVEGVGQVFVGGGSLPAVRVELNPTALNKYGIGLDDVRSMLGSTNVNRPKGQLADAVRTWEIKTNDQLYKAEQYRPLIVAFRSGAPVRLMDLGTVQDSVEDVRTEGLVNGKQAVMVVIFRQPGANIIETVDRVRSLLPQLGASIRQDIDLSVALDRTPSIRGSLKDARNHARDFGHPRDSGGVCVPSESSRYAHPECCGSGIPHRHLCCDVPLRLQSGQPLPHGAYHCHRVCR